MFVLLSYGRVRGLRLGGELGGRRRGDQSRRHPVPLVGMAARPPDDRVLAFPSLLQ